MSSLDWVVVPGLYKEADTLPEIDCYVQSPLQRVDEELSRQEDWKVKVPKF